MEIIYGLQFEWNNCRSFQIVQSQQCSGQEHEAYMYTHVEDFANLTVMHVRRLVLLGCGLTFPPPSLAAFPL